MTGPSILQFWLCFFISTSFLFADFATTENEPSSLVDNIVSAVTGDLYLEEDDIIIQGYEPIHLKRSYTTSYSKWFSFEHLIAEEYPFGHVQITESNGTTMMYIPVASLNDFQKGAAEESPPIRSLLHHIGLTNTGRKAISARTNLRNQYVTFKRGKNQTYLIVHAPDSTKRYFTYARHQPNVESGTGRHRGNQPAYWLLREELLPNGNKILYQWRDKKGHEPRLERIETRSPKGALFAWADFHSKGKLIVTSDGRRLEYEYDQDRRYLSLVKTTDKPDQKIHAIKRNSGNLIDRIELPEGRVLHITYWDDHKNRVKTLRAPVGESADLHEVRFFFYEDQKCTVYDAYGHPTIYHWDKNQRLTKIEEPNSTKIFEWSEEGLLLSKSIVGHFTIHYTYDDRGNIIRERTVSDQTYARYYTYSENNLLLSQTDDNGLVTTYEYLPGTNLPTRIRVGERYTTYEYDEHHILTKITEGKIVKRFIPHTEGPYFGMPKTIIESTHRYDLHYTTGGRIAQKDVYDADDQFRYSLEYTYDKKGRLIEETNPLGQIAKSNYDINGNKTLYQDFGGVTTQTTYDYSNRLIQIQKEAHITRHFYDKRHNKIKTIDSHGYETTYKYDPAGNLIEECPPERTISYTYDSLGNKTSHTDALGYTTYIDYNLHGKTHISYPDGSEERFYYNPDGTLHLYIDQNGIETDYTYDIYGRMTSKRDERWDYDTYDLISYTDAEGHSTTYEYDARGRKIAETLGNERKEFSYDPLGRLSKINDTYFEYDLLDRVVKDWTGDLSTRYSYDERGNKSAIIKGDSKETFVYDLYDRLTQQTDGSGNTTYIAYDDAAHQKITRDPLGLKTIETFNCHYTLAKLDKWQFHEEYTYDQNDNLIKRQNPHTTIIWEYDSMNRVVILNEADQKITRYTYTPKGELKNLTKPDGTALSHTYDSYGYLTELYARDVHYTYKYDKMGRLLHSKNELTGEMIGRTYDPQGHLLTEVINNTLIKNHYDTKGRRILLSLPAGDVEYEYDTALLRKVTFGGITHHYSKYDTRGNLLQEETPYGTVVRTYDKANHPLSITAPHFNHSVQYDAVHNVIEADLNGEKIQYVYDPFYQVASDKDHKYTYDVYYNRLGKDDKTYEVNALDQVSEFTYDANGNPTAISGTKYTYDTLDRLIKLETPDFIETYTYDALHRRLTVTHNGKTTRFLYDDQNEIGTQTELRILGNTRHAEIGAAIAYLIDGETYIPYHDLYGNVAKVLTKDRIESYNYSAFGESPDEGLSPWRFSSKRQDPTGLIYFGRRYYSPSHGRWLTPDPLGFKGGSNLYAYVSNAPLTHLDLYGLFECNYQLNTRYTPWEDYHNISSRYTRPQPHSYSTRLNGAWQAYGGLTEAGVGAMSLIRNRGLLGWSTFIHGLDHFMTGTTIAITGKFREPLTEQLLQRVGTSPRIAYYADYMIGLLSAKLPAARLSFWNKTLDNPTLKATSEIAEEIAKGHAYPKHVLKQKEFPGFSERQFKEHIEHVMNHPTEVKTLTRNRTAYWHQESGTLVIRDPLRKDGGTAFKPGDGIDYFRKLE